MFAAAAALILAHGLRGSGGRWRPVHALAGLAGLALGVLVIRLTAQGLDIDRRTDMDSIVAAALESAGQDKAALIVFAGASYSRNGLDDARLTRALRAAGREVRVVNLSLEGASLQEREAGLLSFLARAPRRPKAVFLEIAPEFDAEAAYVFRVAKFSDRAIAQFTPANTLSALADLRREGCAGAGACAKSAILTLAHGAMNGLGIGLLSSGRPFAGVTPVRAFDPQTEPRERPDDAARHEGLSAPGMQGPARAPAWAAGRRAALMARLEAAGIPIVGTYFPPAIDPASRGYIASLCQTEFAGRPCLAPDDPALLAALDGAHWFDAGHLLASGAEIYTDWLAGRLLAVLP